MTQFLKVTFFVLCSCCKDYSVLCFKLHLALDDTFSPFQRFHFLSCACTESHQDWRWWWRERCRSRGRRWLPCSGRSARSPSTPCSRRWGQRWRSQSGGRVIYRRRGHDMGSEVALSLSGAFSDPVFSSQCNSASDFPWGTFLGPHPRTAKINVNSHNVIWSKYSPSSSTHWSCRLWHRWRGWGWRMIRRRWRWRSRSSCRDSLHTEVVGQPNKNVTQMQRRLQI